MALTPSLPRLLVIDDDEPTRRLVRSIFVPHGFEVAAAADGPSGVDALHEGLDVVLLDLHLPRLSGFEVLERVRDVAPNVPVIMLTASRDIQHAVRAMQLGAYDYQTKPVEPEQIVVVVRRALEARELRREVQDLRDRVGRSELRELESQMGHSSRVREVISQVDTVAGSNFSVLILGETGTGKELVAQAIHRRSPRHARPFVALDCGAIPETLFESELFGHEKGAFTGAERRRAGRFQLAEGGTCFLDEVGNLPAAQQMKLLRVLESKQVQPVGSERVTPIDIRFVAATNHDLQQRVSDRAFRSDLFFRLAQYTIALPALRQRREDIPFLADRFAREVGVELRRPIQGVRPEALEWLQRHDWPGNVRELRNVVRQAVLISKQLLVSADDVRPLLDAGPGRQRAAAEPGPAESLSLHELARRAASEAERHAIHSALRAADGNKSRAARALRTDFKTLHLKMRQLGITARTGGG